MKTFEAYIENPVSLEESMKSILGVGAAAMLSLSPQSSQGDLTQGGSKSHTSHTIRETRNAILTPELLQELKELEGTKRYQAHKGYFKNTKFFPYKDSLGKLTIGYGHLILNGENFSSGITEQEAEALLRKDAQGAINDTNKLLANTPVTPEAAQIIANMVFQMGYTKVAGFKNMWKALRTNDYQKAALEMLNSNWYKQTPKRAKALSARMQKQKS